MLSSDLMGVKRNSWNLFFPVATAQRCTSTETGGSAGPTRVAQVSERRLAANPLRHLVLTAEYSKHVDVEKEESNEGATLKRRRGIGAAALATQSAGL